MRIEGTNIEVEGGEFVVNRQSTTQNMGLIRYINSQRRPLGEDDIHSYFRMPQSTNSIQSMIKQHFEESGMLPATNYEYPILSTQNQMLLDAIQNIRIDSRVAVTDIIRAQDRMTEVDNWVGM